MLRYYLRHRRGTVALLGALLLASTGAARRFPSRPNPASARPTTSTRWRCGSTRRASPDTTDAGLTGCPAAQPSVSHSRRLLSRLSGIVPASAGPSWRLRRRGCLPRRPARRRRDDRIAVAVDPFARNPLQVGQRRLQVVVPGNARLQLPWRTISADDRDYGRLRTAACHHPWPPPREPVAGGAGWHALRGRCAASPSGATGHRSCPPAHPPRRGRPPGW